jgi:hypothetical protein
MLSNDSITFGKFKGKTLKDMLRDRQYCAWLIKQPWFQESYEYLYNRVADYNPGSYFLQKVPEESKGFLFVYPYFNLRTLMNLEIELDEWERQCYSYYRAMIEQFRQRILKRLEDDCPNPFNIKAPVRWLQYFEQHSGISRDKFKEFLSAYELPNIPYIIEAIKAEGGIEYKGAKSFIIAKTRSLAQEKWWEERLKTRYGEQLTVQHAYSGCIFDFLCINTQTIFECKLSLKDFSEEQHRKYKLALEKYRIIYLISTDCVIDMEQHKVFTTNPQKYEDYMILVPTLTNPSYLDKILCYDNFQIVSVSDVEMLFGAS